MQRMAENRKSRYWDGAQWITVEGEPKWLPPGLIRTRDSELARVVFLLVQEFGEDLSVHVIEHDNTEKGTQ